MKDLTIQPKRRAQAWAEQILQELLRQAQQKSLPFMLEHEGGEYVRLANGEAKRLCQEVNLAIRWWNINDLHAEQKYQEHQSVQARQQEPGAGYVKKYESQRIPWRVTGIKQPDETYLIQVQLGGLKKPTKPTLLVQLANQLAQANRKVLLNAQQSPDPFEKWLADASPERRSGVDGSGRNG